MGSSYSDITTAAKRKRKKTGSKNRVHVLRMRACVRLTLCRLHAVYSDFAEFGSYDTVRTGQVYVTVTRQGHAGRGQDVLFLETLDQFGDFVFVDLRTEKGRSQRQAKKTATVPSI